MSTQITIQGMGGLINFEMLVLQKALETAGYIVQVENSEAHWPVSGVDGWYEQVLENKLKSKKKDTIQLIAKHAPWGG